MLFETARANRVNCCNRFLSELACMDRYLTLPRRFSTEQVRLTKPRRELARKQYGSAEDRSRDEAVNASEELFSQRYDDARRASHVAEAVQVLVLGHLADEFSAVGAHASDSVVDAFDCKHDAPEAQRVRRCDRRFDLDQFWIAKLRQLKPPVPIWGPHHNDVDLDTFEPVDAVHPLSLDRRLTLQLQSELGKESDSGCKVDDDDAEVVQSLDRHVPSIGQAEQRDGLQVDCSWRYRLSQPTTWLPRGGSLNDCLRYVG